MTDRPHTRLILELDSHREPISGRMREEGGESRPFSGWLGLAAALRRALASGQGAAVDPGPRPRDLPPG